MKRRTFIVKATSLGISGFLVMGNIEKLSGKPANHHFSTFKNYKTMKPDFLNIIQDAIQAPSSHNTQPWKFSVEDRTISLIPDHSRSLPQADPDHREFYISQGTALENLILSANARGYKTEVTYTLDENPECIEVRLEESGVDKDPLFDFIGKRQTNRNEYDKKMIPEEDWKQLKAEVDNTSSSLSIIQSNELKSRIIEWTVRANEIQLSDPDYKKELISWMRLNKKEAEIYSDGISYKVMGTPKLPRFLGNIILKMAIKPESQNKEDRKNIQSAPALVLFSTNEKGRSQWIEAGRRFQRFALRAASRGISVAHHNQLIQVTETAEDFRNELKSEEYPALLLRTGYAGKAPVSDRREPEEMMV